MKWSDLRPEDLLIFDVSGGSIMDTHLVLSTEIHGSISQYVCLTYFRIDHRVEPWLFSRYYSIASPIQIVRGARLRVLRGGREIFQKLRAEKKVR